MADRYELAFLKNALSVSLTLNPQEQTALENLLYQRLLTSNIQIDPSGLITGNFAPGSITFTIPDGTVTAPGLPFTLEGGTGRYRIAAGNVGESVLGVRAIDWTGTRLQLSNLNLIFANDNTNDIGASGANRPRNLYLGGNAQINGTLQVLGAAGVVGTLIISGPVTFENPVSFSPDNTYDIGAGILRPRDLFVGRNVSIGGTLNVTGATTFSGGLTLSTLSVGTLTVTGATTLGTPLPVPSGGTGVALTNLHGVLIGQGTGGFTSSTAGTAGQVLTSGGATADPAFQAPVPSYDSGTWTPTVIATGGGSGQTYSTQLGSYIKVGKQVTVFFSVGLTSKGTVSGNVAVGGLPFTPSVGAVVPLFWTLATNWASVLGFTAVGNPWLWLIGTSAIGTSNNFNVTGTDLANVSQFNGSVTYSTP